MAGEEVQPTTARAVRALLVAFQEVAAVVVEAERLQPVVWAVRAGMGASGFGTTHEITCFRAPSPIRIRPGSCSGCRLHTKQNYWRSAFNGSPGLHRYD